MSKILSVETNGADGTAFTFFATLSPLSQLFVKNISGATIDVAFAGDEAYFFPLKDGEAYPFTGLQNANQIGVRRTDQTTDQVTVNAIAEGL